MAITNQKTGSVLQVAGLDISKPAEYISDQACSQCQNVEVIESLLSKRVGESQLGAVIRGTGIEIMGGRQFTREDVNYNVRVGLDKIEVWDAANTEWDDITGSDLTGANTDLVDTAVPLLTGKSILCITNGKDAIRKYIASGNTADLGGTPPVADFIQEYKTYLVCANIGGGTDIAQRVQWSDTADPETWTGGNSGAVDLVDDGGGITGLNLFGNYLSVHKDKSIYLGYLVSSSAIFKFDRKATGVGTVANGSIVNIPTGEQIFLSKDGLRLFNGNTAPLIEAPINDEIRRSLNKTQANRAWGMLVLDKDEVWIGIPVGDYEVGSTIYKFNYAKRVLYKDYRENITVMWKGDSTSGLSWDDIDIAWDDYDYRWDDTAFGSDAEQLNLGYTTGEVTKSDVTTYQDKGVSYDSFWDSKDFEHAQGIISRWKRMEFWAMGGSCRILYSVDAGATWVEMPDSSFTLAGSMPSDESPLIAYFDVVSSKIRIRFQNTSNESFKLKQFVLEYTPREMRR